MSRDVPIAKKRRIAGNETNQQYLRASRLYAPFRHVGLVSPTAVPFTALPLGKKTFQITTSVGQCLQTYDLRRGLNLVFITRPQTPGPITATCAWTDKVYAAWQDANDESRRGIWAFKRGKVVGELQMPHKISENIVQILVMGAWIIGCCTTKIEVWSSTSYEHYTTLECPAAAAGQETEVLTGGICNMPTYSNKIVAGREDGRLELWNVSTGRLVYTIQPPASDSGPVCALQPSPALSLLAVAYMNGHVVLHDISADVEILRLNAGGDGNSPVTSISFRTDGLGAGDDGQADGVMATASYSTGDVTFWDLNDGGKRMGVLRGAHNQPSDKYEGSDGGISKIEFLSNQAVIVTSGLDNSLKTWIFDETPFSPIPRILHSRAGHAAPITTLNFLPPGADGSEAGGKWLLSTSKDRSLWGWSLRKDGQSTELSQGHIKKKAKKLGLINGAKDSSNTIEGLKAPEITCLASSLNRDGGMGTLPGASTLWASAKQLKGKSTATEQNLTGWESVVTGHRGDKHARTWFWGRKRAGRWLLETGDGSEVKSVAISPCGTFALVGSEAGGIDMYNLQSGLHRQRFPARLTPAQAKKLAQSSSTRFAKGQGKHTGAVSGLHVDSLNRFVISSSLDGKVKFWDFVTGLLRFEIDWHSATSITAMTAHRSNALIALTCTDDRIRVVDIETQRLVRELGGSAGTIKDACFSNDGRWIVAASADKTVRTWDLPTGHLIDAMRLPTPCTALAFSNTGEFLATTQEDSIGISIWTNRTLFTHVPTRHISEEEIASVEAPVASGEGGQGILAGAFDEVEGELPQLDADMAHSSIEQLSKDVTTLSLVPRSRWQTLLHLDLIRERNKPKEPPKAPERAPFFLPSLDQPTQPNTSNAIATIDDAAGTSNQDSALAVSTSERSRISKLDLANQASSNAFSTLLQQCANQSYSSYAPFIEHLKTLAPSATDVQIRSLSISSSDDSSNSRPTSEVVAFINALTERLDAKRDYELVQAWMAVFLKCHGDVVRESEEVKEALRRWRISQRRESERLGSLVGYCGGVIGFLRSAR